MKKLTLDGSLTLSWFLPGKFADQNQVVRKMIEAGTKALVPSIWALEVANALLSAERRNHKKGRVYRMLRPARGSALRQIHEEHEGTKRTGL